MAHPSKLSLTLSSLVLLTFAPRGLSPSSAFAAECPRQATFIFREGDTLSEVLWFLGTEPVYGKRGWIEKTIAMNPKLEKYRNGQIPPGTSVMIPIIKCPLKGGWKINAKGELEAPYHHSKEVIPAEREESEDEERESSAEESVPATPTVKPTVAPKATATATPTVKPTVAPKATATATPTPSLPTSEIMIPMTGRKVEIEATVPPIAAPTAKATAVATPTAKATPIATPTTKATAVATPTTKATAVATPTAKATPIATPTAKATPIATPTTKATPIATPTTKATPAPNTKSDKTHPKETSTKAESARKPQESNPVKTPSPTPPPPATKTPTPDPSQQLRQGLKNSKETFEKAKGAEQEFLDKVKQNNDFVIE